MKLTIINEENNSKLTVNNVDQETIDRISNDNTISSSLADNELTVTANSINVSVK